MKYRQLGKSNLQISEIGFGCMSLGDDEAETARIIHRAIDLGIIFFDTADLYQHGMNEIAVGKALASKRKDVIIATKVGNQWRKDGSGWDWNPRKEYILDCVDKSLKRLQTDYIDLYQLHGGTIEDNIDETIEAFELLLQKGKIRFYGISSIRPNVIGEYVRRSNIVSVMMQYSLLDRRPEETCLDLLLQNNIGVLSRGNLAQGLLINKKAEAYLDHSETDVSNAAKEIRNLSGEKRTQSQTAIRYTLQHPAVTSVVVGIRTMHQLEQAVGTIHSPMLSESEILQLKNVITANAYQQHR